MREGYKKTEVGVIPSDWLVKELGKYVVITSGESPSKFRFNDDGIPYFKVDQLNNGDKYLKETPYHIESKICVPKGSIIFPKRGASILLNKVRILAEDSFMDTNLMSLTISNELDNEYLYYSVVYTELWRIADTTSIPQINNKHIIPLKIPLPHKKAEQTAIATALSDADALISSLEKLIAKKRDIKQGTMQQLLTSKKRLPGFSGEWEVKRLEEIAKIVSGGTPKTNTIEFWNGNIKWCTPTDITNCQSKYLSTTERTISKKGLEHSSATLLPKGTLLLCSRATIGEIRIADMEICTNQGFKSLVCSVHVNNEFLYYYILTIKSKLIEKSTGSTFLEISKKDISEIEFFLPQIEEQTAIAQILSDMDAEIEALEQKLAKYRMLKQGMMQELLTGSIRLLNTETSEKPKALVKAMSEKNDSQKKKHNWAFNEAVVISVLSKTFGALDYPLGRKRYTKFSYLLHRYAERNAEGYLKKAAGPYNPDTRYKGPEKIAQNRGYIKAHSSGNYTGYIADDNIDEAVAYFNKWYGMETLQWLEQFRYKDNDQLELLTTVDMAVQDLLQNNQEVSIASVKALIQSYDEWRAKLKRTIFSDNNINAAIRLSEDLFGY